MFVLNLASERTTSCPTCGTPWDSDINDTTVMVQRHSRDCADMGHTLDHDYRDEATKPLPVQPSSRRDLADTLDKQLAERAFVWDPETHPVTMTRIPTIVFSIEEMNP